MKKWLKVALCGLCLGAVGIGLTACGSQSANIEFRVENGYIQYLDNDEWKNLIALEDLKGEDGTDGKDGKDGADGEDLTVKNCKVVYDLNFTDCLPLAKYISNGSLSFDESNYVQVGDGADNTTGEIDLKYSIDIEKGNYFDNYDKFTQMGLGKYFEGWHTEDGVLIDDYRVVARDITLKAKWNNDLYTDVGLSGGGICNVFEKYDDENFTCSVKLNYTNSSAIQIPYISVNNNKLYTVNKFIEDSSSIDNINTIRLDPNRLENADDIFASDLYANCEFSLLGAVELDKFSEYLVGDYVQLNSSKYKNLTDASYGIYKLDKSNKTATLLHKGQPYSYNVIDTNYYCIISQKISVNGEEFEVDKVAHGAITFHLNLSVSHPSYPVKIVCPKTIDDLGMIRVINEDSEGEYDTDNKPIFNLYFCGNETELGEKEYAPLDEFSPPLSLYYKHGVATTYYFSFDVYVYSETSQENSWHDTDDDKIEIWAIEE